MNIVEVHKCGLRDSIIKLASLLEQPHYTPDGSDPYVELITRITALGHDYLYLKKAPYSNDTVGGFFDKTPDADVEYLNFISVEQFVRMIGCTADIRTNLSLIDGVIPQIQLMHLGRAIKSVHDHFKWFVLYKVDRAADGGLVTADADEEYLETDIMRPAVASIYLCISRIMAECYKELNQNDISALRMTRLESLLGSCVLYMHNIGTSFSSKKWVPAVPGDTEPKVALMTWDDWRRWTSMPKCPLYLTYYDPIRKKVVEFSVDAPK